MHIDLRGAQRRHENFFVVADVAMVEVPGRDMPIEERIAIHHLEVKRPNLRQIAVWRRQKRVEELQSNVSFVGHGGRMI